MHVYTHVHTYVHTNIYAHAYDISLISIFMYVHTSVHMFMPMPMYILPCPCTYYLADPVGSGPDNGEKSFLSTLALPTGCRHR